MAKSAAHVAGSKNEPVTDNTVAGEVKPVEAKENKPVEVEQEEKKDPGMAKNKMKVINGRVKVESKKRAGKTVVAVSGEAITFDKDGLADVAEQDAIYLATIPGFNFK